MALDIQKLRELYENVPAEWRRGYAIRGNTEGSDLYGVLYAGEDLTVEFDGEGALKASRLFHEIVTNFPTVLAALRSYEAAEPAGWQPIETAPKDGTIIHIWANGYEWPEAVKWVVYDPADAEEIGEDGYWTYAEQLLADVTESTESEHWTHWRPLPSAPSLQASQENNHG